MWDKHWSDQHHAAYYFELDLQGNFLQAQWDKPSWHPTGAPWSSTAMLANAVRRRLGGGPRRRWPARRRGCS